MSEKKKAAAFLALSQFKLRHRFMIQLGGIAAVSFLLFFLFGRYALGLTENEFE